MPDTEYRRCEWTTTRTATDWGSELSGSTVDWSEARHTADWTSPTREVPQ